MTKYIIPSLINMGVPMSEYLSISDMAELHNITRQTLIYYDKIGLFKPDHTEANGYRAYDSLQIPVLREICYLKNVGIPLDEIRKHIGNRSLDSAASLLKSQKEALDREIARLTLTREFISHRLDFYDNMSRYRDDLDNPSIIEFPERYAVFVPFENPICRKELHITLMKAWKILWKHDMLSSDGFGTLIRQEGIDGGDWFRNAGVIAFLPYYKEEIGNKIIIEPGKYVCMNKNAMPYERDPLTRLLDHISHEGYEMCGDVLDLCLLDTTFYGADRNVDYCQLQIPIR